MNQKELLRFFDYKKTLPEGDKYAIDFFSSSDGCNMPLGSTISAFTRTSPLTVDNLLKELNKAYRGL